MNKKILSSIVSVLCLMSIPAYADVFNQVNLNSDQLSIANMEIGTKTWLSTGGMEWNHAAQGTSLGDPTSVLEYKDATSLMLELNGRADLNNGYFVRGTVGIGQIYSGVLEDSDYLSPEAAAASNGPERFSLSKMNIEEDDTVTASIDVGAVLFKKGNLKTDIYAGYRYWRESYKTYGLTQVEDPYSLFGGTGKSVADSVNVISNEVTWHSVRIGLDSTLRISSRVDLGFDLALIPYTKMHNEDRHHLRTDLSQNPSVEMDGSGYGGEIELDLTYHASANLDLSIGARYWSIVSDGDIDIIAADGSKATGLKLNDLDASRYGVTAGMSYRF